MEEFQIYPVQLGSGAVAISPMPGRTGDFSGDVTTLLAWKPALVLTMTTTEELQRAAAVHLSDRLQDTGVAWQHLPIEDFGAPRGQTAVDWTAASKKAHGILASGGRVLAHCWGGNGRSGMAVLRLMVEAGIAPDIAMAKLRAVRPGAVETEAQRIWATTQ